MSDNTRRKELACGETHDYAKWSFLNHNTHISEEEFDAHYDVAQDEQTKMWQVFEKIKRQRKPYRTVRVHDENVPHRCKKDIVVEVWPNGVLTFREQGRRSSSALATTAGEIYADLMMRAARRAILEKRKAKKLKKKS